MIGYSRASRRTSASSFYVLLSAGLGLVALGGCKLYRVEPLGPLHEPAKGIVYVLPQTELVMDVEIERTVLSLGRFAKFAVPFGMTPTPVEKQCPDGSKGEWDTEWRYACTPKILTAAVSAVGVPDPDMRFHVTILSERKAVDRSVDFALLEDARLTKADAVVHDRSAEIAVRVITKALEIAATVASTMFALLVTDHPCKERLEGLRDTRKIPVARTEEGKACDSYARLVQLSEHREEVIEALKNLESLTEGAVKAAVAMLDVLESEMRSIEALFGVTQTTTTRTVRRAFIPKPARRSRTFRVTDKGELVIDEAGGQLKLTVAVDPMSPPPPGREVSTKRCGTTSGSGLVYRLPASGTAQVVSGVRILASERVNLPQFGRLASLPGCFRKNKTTLNVTVSPNTGMLETILLKEETVPSDDAIQKDLEAIGTASDTLAKAVAKAGAEDTELKALENEKALLEAEKNKLEAERQLNCYKETGKPCSDQ